MSRPVVHLIFWLTYYLVRVLIEYLWVKSAILTLAPGALLAGSFLAAFFYLLPEMIVAYFLLYYALDKLLLVSRDRLFRLLEVLIVLCVGIYSVRLMAHNLVAPIAYQGQLPISPVFEVQRILLILVDMGLSSGLLIAIEYIHRQFKYNEREKNLIREKLSTELQLLRNQIHPHFLFNTLNNIYALTRKKSDRAPEVVMKLSELLSFMLYKSGEETISIGEEIRVLEDYIELEKIRYDHRLSVEFKQEIDDLSQPIIPLLLLPLVENAFKYGISDSRFDSFIYIQLSVHGSWLRFIVKNSIETSGTETQAGNLGLYATQRQLELTYKEHRLLREADNQTFRIQLDINLRSYGKI